MATRELSIHVEFPGVEGTTYKFGRFPVSIGRSPECHLSICHESVPRELCQVWLEDGGRTVRVEERPGLTNPLLSRGASVRGGISGRRVEAEVGPVRFELVAGGEPESHGDGSRRKRFAITVVAALLVVGAVLVGVYSPGVRDPLPDLEELGSLPEHPFCAAQQVSCREPLRCHARARMLASRGRELWERPSSAAGTRVRAASMLERAALLYEAAGSREAGEARRVADHAREKVSRQYRNAVASLGRELRRRGRSVRKEAIRVLAGEVVAFLESCDGPAIGWLNGLAAASRAEEVGR